MDKNTKDSEEQRTEGQQKKGFWVVDRNELLGIITYYFDGHYITTIDPEAEVTKKFERLYNVMYKRGPQHEPKSLMVCKSDSIQEKAQE